MSAEQGMLTRREALTLIGAAAASLALPACAAPPAPEEGSAGSAGGSSDKLTAERVEPETPPAPNPVDPSTLPAETVLTAEDLELAGGADAFFWVQEIGDVIFARMEGRSYPADCTVPLDQLRYVRVLHVDADGRTKVGELVVNAAITADVLEIFRGLYDGGYPIERMRLVDDYGADDELSMEDNNTSSFCFRIIMGTDRLSQHAYGLAIDVNTFYNPYYIVSSGYVAPQGSEPYVDRSVESPYRIDRGDLCYQLFTERGFSWGGDWSDPKDYQHFETYL